MEAIHGLFDQPVALRQVLDDLPLGVVILDPERRIIFVNRAMEGLTGFDGEEAKGIPCSYILRTSLCFQGCPAGQALETGETASREGDIISRDRQKIAVRMTSTPLKDEEARLVGFLETVEDLRPVERRDEKIPRPYSFGRMLGRSPQMEELFRILPMVAQTDSSVLVTGETGTGKDLLAEAIHLASDRAGGPFIKVNCGALPETLLESELFGHTKGAFTGAVEEKPGRLRLAHNGTLYLTEIGDLPLQLQVKLLTFLDDKVVHPLGGTKDFRANVRIVAATHRDLEQMVGRDEFRRDLLYRLKVVQLHLPPLRERGGDLALLLDHFLSSFADRFAKKITAYSPRARQVLLNYDYPGNVRELQNIVEYAANICQEESIKPEHLPSYLTEPGADRPELSVSPLSGTGLAAGAQPGQAEAVNWEAIERRLILEALIKAKGRRKEAAAILGWGRSTLWRKIKQYGIDS